MDIVKGVAAPVEARGAVMAIGNFDGVHIGHQQVIGLAKQLAKTKNCRSGVLSFEPHPVQVFRPDTDPFRLTPQAARTRRLAEIGVDIHVIVPFSREFAAKTPEQFVQEILVDGLAISHVVVGHDFHYGHDRLGTIETLQQAAIQNGFGLSVLDEVADEGGGPISSSAARAALKAANPREAATILGRPWEIESVVQYGDQRGRELGYPTANMVLGDHLRPAFGIYAVETAIASADDPNDWGPWLPGVANLGIRPMYRSEEPLLEVFLFDFDQDIYDRTLRVRLIEHLRPEMAFDSVDELIAQMDRDSEKSKAILADHEWLTL